MRLLSPDFSDEKNQFAIVELTTTKVLQAEIIYKINSRLNEFNGYEASLRIVDYVLLGLAVHQLCRRDGCDREPEKSGAKNCSNRQILSQLV